MSSFGCKVLLPSKRWVKRRMERINEFGKRRDHQIRRWTPQVSHGEARSEVVNPSSVKHAREYSVGQNVE
uniref:Uncharacterized protein n=1 Tax=Brassica oleracea var. oleracea TaxID=109376 RepID=A0A0D3ARY2_BRAOL